MWLQLLLDVGPAPRVGDGESAWRRLDIFVKAFTLRNGFHANGDQTGRGFSGFTYRPFTLEGNMLAAAAVHEMLLQSWSPTPGQRDTEVLRFFPATSGRWHDVTFDNLRAEGGHILSAKRENNATVWFRIVAGKDGTVRIRDNFGGRIPQWNRAGVQKVGANFEVSMKRGEVLEARLAKPGQLPRSGREGEARLLQEAGLLEQTLTSTDAPTTPTEKPRLNFSDLTSGPKTGNSDTSGSEAAGKDGVIVTVWGTGLGESQGTSQVLANGAEAARIYYWGNARPPYSPADLHVRQRMQMVIFQVSHLAKNGPGGIAVVVDGQTSNILPFTVRPGRIFFVATRGDDVHGTGTWSKPWAGMPRAVKEMSAGDTTYVCDGIKQTTEDTEHAAVNLSVNGRPDRPCAFAAYPGARVNIGNDQLVFGFRHWRSGYGSTHDWILSKFQIRAHSDAVVLNTGFRVVGNWITAPTGSSPSGAIEGGGNDLFVLGNEVTRVGKPGASKLYHPIYISSDRAGSGPRKPAESNREIAWNYLHDNTANRAINIYSEGASTAYMSRHKVHDNFIINQVGGGILLGRYMTGENWVYNNVIANAGLGPEPTDGDRGQGHIGVEIAPSIEGGPATTLFFFNNTIYGCGWSGAVWGPSGNGEIAIDNPRAFTLVFKNNLIVSTGEPYEAARRESPPQRNGHNLWFGAGRPPRWDANALQADPLFVNPAAGDFHLRFGSPAIDRGVDVGIGVDRDLDNVPRPQGKALDLGAYEFVPVKALVPRTCSPA